MASRFQRPFYILLSLLVVGLFIETFPYQTPFDQNLKPGIHKVVRSLGLWQSWNMFSPNPTREDVTMFAQVNTEKGESKHWSPIRMSELSLTDKYLKERWRKWGMDNIRSDSHRDLWPSLGRYIQRSFEHRFPEDKITDIKVYREWYVIPKLEDRFILRKDITKEPKHNYHFYTYDPVHIEGSHR